MNRTVYFLKSNQTKLILNRISVFFKNPTEILKNLFHTSLKATQPKAVENDAFTRLRICLRPHVTLTFDLLHRSCCDTMGIYHNMWLKFIIQFLKYLAKKGFFHDLLTPKVYCFMLLPCGPLVPTVIIISSFVFKISCSQVC